MAGKIPGHLQKILLSVVAFLYGLFYGYFAWPLTHSQLGLQSGRLIAPTCL